MYTKPTQGRASKGFICVGVDKGYLRLQFPRTLFADGKQRYVTLKLKDTPENRVIAEQFAKDARPLGGSLLEHRRRRSIAHRTTTTTFWIARIASSDAKVFVLSLRNLTGKVNFKKIAAEAISP